MPIRTAFALVVLVALATGCSKAAEPSSEAPATGGDEAAAPAVDSTTAAVSPTTEAAAPVTEEPFSGTYPGEAATNPEETTPSGLKSIVLQEGTGAQAQVGQPVAVHYTGYLLDGTKFDSSVDRGTPLTFTLGGGEVIDGWEEGVALMKVGEKRKLIVPASLGYGAMGYPPVIPPNATLVFDVELVSAG